MIDIVERLRKGGVYLGNAIAGYRDRDTRRCAEGLTDAAASMLEAADEIERLRRNDNPARIERLADLNERLINENARLKAALVAVEGMYKDEIERLRAALESLTRDPPATFAREPDTDDEVIIKMRAIAQAALKGEP